MNDFAVSLNDGRGQQYQGDLLIAGGAAGPQAGRTLK
jgi:hypothetical protein